jgi:Ser/Thr protein kinase RdoA (MazF antagonist)
VLEEPLPGRATSGIVRVGDTVRRPAGPWTDAVDALLAHLRAVGFTGAPEPLGRDSQGRQVLEFVPGALCSPAGTLSLSELAEVGSMVRDLHSALASFAAPANAGWNNLIPVIPTDRFELVCHNDVAPWNLVRSPRGWVLIDWDGAGPSSRLWDLAYAAQSMAGMGPDRSVEESALRFRTFIRAYGSSQIDPDELAALLGRRARAMYDMLARATSEPWKGIFATDGAHWLGVASYLETYKRNWLLSSSF